MQSDNTCKNETKPGFVLYVWPGEWDLPSLDPECLVAMCLLKFSQIDHKVITVVNSWQLFQNDYPRLEHADRVFTGIDQIIEGIKQVNNIDRALNDNNYSDMFALLNLFKQKFIPAFNMLSWTDEENTYKIVRKAYGKHVRFPLSMFKLKRMSQKAEKSIIHKYRMQNVQFDTFRQQILSDSIECLNLVAAQLSDNTFLFENRSTGIDAFLFGYLSILYKAPFLNAQLKTHLSACTNLVSLVLRVQRELFPTDKKVSESEAQFPKHRFLDWIFSLLKLNKDSVGVSSMPQRASLIRFEEWEKRKQQLIAVTIGLAAMVTYAFAIGLIKIDVIKTDIEFTEKS